MKSCNQKHILKSKWATPMWVVDSFFGPYIVTLCPQTTHTKIIQVIYLWQIPKDLEKSLWIEESNWMGLGCFNILRDGFIADKKSPSFFHHNEWNSCSLVKASYGRSDFFRCKFSLFFKQKNLVNFVEMCFSSVISTNFAI
jgi:hypothetical protein